MVDWWPGYLDEIQENLGKRTFPCFNCNLKYELDADGVEAARNAPVRRKCPKCGHWMTVMMRGNNVYDVSSGSSLSPEDVKNGPKRNRSSTSGSGTRSSTRKREGNFPEGSGPFDDKSNFTSIRPPLGTWYVGDGFGNYCNKCKERDVLWEGIRREKDIYTILKCGDCNSVWAAKGSYPLPDSLDEWVQIPHEDSLEEPDTQSKVKKGTRDECFIATAAFGTPHSQEINHLREFRDKISVPHKASSANLT